MNNISLMDITFDNPLLLLLMIPLIVIAFIPYLKLKPKRRHTRNKVTSLILHCLIIILACFVLSGIEGHNVKNVNSEIVLVTDCSDSTAEVQEEMSSYVDKFIGDTRNKGSEIGLVYFGYGECQYVELAKPSNLDKNNKKGEKLDSTGTDIEAAIIKAVSLFDKDDNEKLVKRIILLSDAIDTDGSISSLASILNQNNIRLDAIYFEPRDYNTTAEAQIENIKVDDGVVPFKPTNITVSVKSHSITSAYLKVTDNGESIFNKDVIINLDGSGLEQEFVYEYTFNEAGVHEVKAEIVATNNNDLVADNNIFYTYAYLEAENSILIIAPDGEDSTNLVSSIESYGYNPTVISPIDAPETVSGLAEYKEVILLNVNTASLPAKFANVLRAYVEQAGGSLLTAGGDNTYANGNMKNSLYEDMLPISLTPQANNPRAIVLCVDYSNSMGMKDFAGTELFSKSDSNLQTPQSKNGKDTRILTAIKGIVESIKTSLNPYDYLSVITFGPIKADKGINETNVVFGLTPATQKEDMIEKVQAIRKPSTQGGTDYDEALEYAEDMLTTFTKKVNKKSVVLINDYDSGNDDAVRYMSTIQRMLNNGIDFSTIVIGNQKSSNVQEMETIIGANNSYLTQTETQFATVIKELCRSIPTKTVNTLKANARFEIEDGSRIGTGINPNNLPLINTYNGGVNVKEKATSHIVFHNQEEVEDPNNPGKTVVLNNRDPIYAEWTFGAGKVGSLMIDLSGEWCPDFYSNAETMKILHNIVTNLAPKNDVDVMKITVDGFKLQNNPDEIKIQNANYTRLLEIELIQNTTDNSEIEEPIEQTISLEVKIAKYDVKTDKEKVIDSFTLSSKSGDKYEKNFETRDPGIYAIHVTEKIDGTIVAQKTAYTAFSYSEEYDTFYNTSEKLTNLAELCNETYTESAGNRISGKVYYGTAGIESNADSMTTSINQTINFQIPLMLIALLLFILDICVRKFNFLWPHEIINKMRKKEE